MMQIAKVFLGYAEHDYNMVIDALLAAGVINEDLVADVWMFHMVGYSRVGSRINFTPSISTNSELHLEEITFK